MSERIVKWRTPKGEFEGTIVGAVNDGDQTFIVVHCTDGYVREVPIAAIVPI
jgi:hypothetical protein